MDGTMQQNVSMAVTNPDTPTPGIGGEEMAESKGYSKEFGSEIFDSDF